MCWAPLCADHDIFPTVFFPLGNIHLFWLWEVGPAEKRGLYLWVPVPRGPRPPVTRRTDRQTAGTKERNRNKPMKTGDAPADIPGFDLSSPGERRPKGRSRGEEGGAARFASPLPPTWPSNPALPSSHWQSITPYHLLLLYTSFIFYLPSSSAVRHETHFVISSAFFIL